MSEKKSPPPLPKFPKLVPNPLENTKQKDNISLQKGIVKWVEDKKKQAENPNNKNVSKSKPWGWFIGIFVSILIFFVLAFYAWKAWKNGRKIAILNHELDVIKETKQKKEIDEKLEKNTLERLKNDIEIKVLESKIKLIKGKIIKLENDRLRTHELIKNITTWEESDKLLEKLNEKIK